MYCHYSNLALNQLSELTGSKIILVTSETGETYIAAEKSVHVSKAQRAQLLSDLAVFLEALP